MPTLPCALALAVGLSLGGCADAPVAPAPQAAPDIHASLARPGAQVDPIAARDLVSIYRAGKGLPTLAVDPALQRVAQAQAQAMAAAGGADAAVRKGLAARLAQEGVKPGFAAQNVSSGYHNLAEAFSGWRESPPHNATMLATKARRMGIATAYAPNAKYKVYWALVVTD